jgi:hypothetical protein
VSTLHTASIIGAEVMVAAGSSVTLHTAKMLDEATTQMIIFSTQYVENRHINFITVFPRI